MTPDSSGLITINVTNPDPRPYGSDRNNHDIEVTVTVERAPGNTLSLVDKTMGEVVTATKVEAQPEVFSDNPEIAHSLSATAGAQWRLLRSSGNRNSVNVSVLDQYGDAFTDTDYSVTATPSSRDGQENETQTGDLRNTGTRQLSYNYGDDGPSEEMITVTGGATNELTLADGDDDDSDPDPLRVYWADRGTASNGDEVALLVGDARQNELIVNPNVDGFPADPVAPEAYSFGDDDRFVVEGSGGLHGAVRRDHHLRFGCLRQAELGRLRLQPPQR